MPEILPELVITGANRIGSPALWLRITRRIESARNPSSEARWFREEAFTGNGAGSQSRRNHRHRPTCVPRRTPRNRISPARRCGPALPSSSQSFRLRLWNIEFLSVPDLCLQLIRHTEWQQRSSNPEHTTESRVMFQSWNRRSAGSHSGGRDFTLPGAATMSDSRHHTSKFFNEIHQTNQGRDGPRAIPLLGCCQALRSQPRRKDANTVSCSQIGTTHSDPSPHSPSRNRPSPLAIRS